MHLSARSELKSELADSRIGTKLPIKDARVLHVCLSGRGRFTCGCDKMRVMRKGGSQCETPFSWLAIKGTIRVYTNP
jgi:hypothetical protein